MRSLAAPPIESGSQVLIEGLLKLTRTGFTELSLRGEIDHETSRLVQSILLWKKLPLDLMRAHRPLRFTGNREASIAQLRGNVFIIYPYALGHDSAALSEINGYEFLDVSARIYRDIIEPALDRTAVDPEKLKSFLTQDMSFEQLTYLYAIAHEFAHSLGFWRVIGPREPANKTSAAVFDWASELQADVIALKLLNDPQVSAAHLLMRLFWYLRPSSRKLDADAIVGLVLIKHLETTGALDLRGGHLNLVMTKIQPGLEVLANELENCGNRLEAMRESEQTDYMEKWLQLKTGLSADQTELQDQNMMSVFSRCLDLPTQLFSR